MFRKIALAGLLAVGALAAVIASRPSDYRVERSTTIAAQPAVVYSQVSDFKAWAAWSPWEALDPNMHKTYTGQPGQPGSSYEWKGNKDVGSGRMTVEGVQAPSKIEIKLAFIEPWESTCQTTFSFDAVGNQTKVTWTMVGHNGFVEKAMTLWMDMDKMVGGDFEKGLRKLSEAAQKEQAKQLEQAQQQAAAAAEAARKAAEASATTPDATTPATTAPAAKKS
jgi:hypothetical protein